jgi:succinate dehydrogenase / fumarate reductase, cytochrome b subunit
MPRPRNVGIFDLMQYRFPVMAIASIFHRITGVLLLIYIPFVLYYLHLSLEGSAKFFAVKMLLCGDLPRFFLWLFLSAFGYHVLAGLKHLVMDMGHWESLRAARISSSAVMILGVLVAIGLGVWVW